MIWLLGSISFLNIVQTHATESPFSTEMIQGISQDPQWLALLHYRPHLPFNKLKSEVDDPTFFLSPSGKTNADAELIATLKAFSGSISSNAVNATSATCRFPARYHWLNQQRQRYPKLPTFQKANCPAYEQFFNQVSGNQLTLVFPASQLNSPSSMYGHTLFRVDSDVKAPLLAYSITYAAHADPNDNQILYSFRGLFGGYPGYFSIVPYHQKVKEYSRIESRDVWEYPLNIPQTTLDQMLRHTWELKDIQFDYFFFNENCSYRLLTLLDAADVQYNLTEPFRFRAIPLDTVKAFANKNLIADTKYRPSHTTKIKHMLANIDDTQLRQAERWAASKEPIALTDQHFEKELKQTPSKSAQTLDLAIAYNRELARHHKYKESLLRTRAMELLSWRSQLNTQQVFPDIPAPPMSDDQGHPSYQWQFSLGQNQTLSQDEQSAFIASDFRFAYHDLMDPAEGYPLGSSLEMGRFSTIWRSSQGIQIQKASLLNIESFSPRGDLFSPLSWRVQTGLDRYLDQHSPMFASFNAGVGYSYSLYPNSLAFFLISGDLRASPLYTRGTIVSAGPEIGFLYRYQQQRYHLRFIQHMGVFQEEARRQAIRFSWTHSITPATQFGLHWRYETSGIYKNANAEGTLGFQWYF